MGFRHLPSLHSNVLRLAKALEACGYSCRVERIDGISGTTHDPAAQEKRKAKVVLYVEKDKKVKCFVFVPNFNSAKEGEYSGLDWRWRNAKHDVMQRLGLAGRMRSTGQPAAPRKTCEEETDPLVKAILERFGEMYGITRLDYAKTGKGWWVRLGWKDGLPICQRSVYDSQHRDDPEVSLAAAKAVRNELIESLIEAGYFGRKRPTKTRFNKTGIAGMTLQRSPSKTGAGYHLNWKVNWTENGKTKGRTFAFSTWGSGYEAFAAGALCRRNAEMREYGSSMIDPDEEILRQMYEQAMRNYGEMG